MPGMPTFLLLCGFAAGACGQPAPSKKLQLGRETVQRLDAGAVEPPHVTHQATSPPTNQAPDPRPR
jgi:hypothetical protein